MRKTPFQNKPRKPLKRSGFKRPKFGENNAIPEKVTVEGLRGLEWRFKRSTLRKIGVSPSAKAKQGIQALVRAICIKRDGGCILKKYRHCNDEVLQADHLVTRGNSGTFADTRLIVCLCRTCHGWKHWHKEEYDALVKTVIPKERVELWEKAEQDRLSHKTHKMDWSIERLALEQELLQYERN